MWCLKKYRYGFAFLAVLGLSRGKEHLKADSTSEFKKKRLGGKNYDVKGCSAACQIHGVHVLWEEEKGSNRPHENERRIIETRIFSNTTEKRQQKYNDVSFFSCRTLWDELNQEDKYLPMHEVGLMLSQVEYYGLTLLELGEWTLCFRGGSPAFQQYKGRVSILPSDVPLKRTSDILEMGRTNGLLRIQDFRHLNAFPSDNSHRSGIKTLLVVRVSTPAGEGPSASALTLERAIFGPLTPDAQAKDYATLAAQYHHISHGALNFIPATFSNGRVNAGVLDIEFGGFGTGESIQFLSRDLVQAAEAALGLNGSTRLQDIVHHTMFCLPDEVQAPLLGSTSDWTAFTYIYEPFSFYRLNRCSKLSVVAHEIGHATLGFRHSGAYRLPSSNDVTGVRLIIDGVEVVEDEYADETGYMGYSVNLYGRPRKAFNAHKHWLTPWYNDWSKVSIEDPLLIARSLEIELVGYVAYQASDFTASTAGRKGVLVRIADSYLQYNYVPDSTSEEKWNADIAYPNQVTLVQSDEHGTVSFLRRVLAVGGSFVEENYKGSGRSVVVGICPATIANRFAKSVMLHVRVIKAGENSRIVCPMNPTRNTTPAPVLQKSRQPTFLPTNYPTNAPIWSPSTKPDDVFLDTQRGSPTAFPTRRELIVEVEEEPKQEDSTSAIDTSYIIPVVAILILALIVLTTAVWFLVWRNRGNMSRKQREPKKTLSLGATHCVQSRQSSAMTKSSTSTETGSDSPSIVAEQTEQNNTRCSQNRGGKRTVQPTTEISTTTTKCNKPCPDNFRRQADSMTTNPFDIHAGLSEYTASRSESLASNCKCDKLQSGRETKRAKKSLSAADRESLDDMFDRKVKHCVKAGEMGKRRGESAPKERSHFVSKATMSLQPDDPANHRRAALVAPSNMCSSMETRPMLGIEPMNFLASQGTGHGRWKDSSRPEALQQSQVAAASSSVIVGAKLKGAGLRGTSGNESWGNGKTQNEATMSNRTNKSITERGTRVENDSTRGLRVDEGNQIKQRKQLPVEPSSHETSPQGEMKSEVPIIHQKKRQGKSDTREPAEIPLYSLKTSQTVFPKQCKTTAESVDENKTKKEIFGHPHPLEVHPESINRAKSSVEVGRPETSSGLATSLPKEPSKP